MSKFTKIHLKTIKQTFQYFADIKNINLIYKEKFLNVNFYNYTNSNFAANENNR